MANPQAQRTPNEFVNDVATRGALRTTYEEPLNKIELKAIYGMVSYVAHTQKVGEAVVGEVMTSHFGAAAVAALPSRFYQDAIEYLMDLKMDKVIN